MPAFSRSFALPEKVSADAVRSEMKDGVVRCRSTQILMQCTPAPGRTHESLRIHSESVSRADERTMIRSID
ncbi:MAG: Hsp20/alpha crystallin family protein [Gammaproteobacteria bacterium]|nr:MAG: Hsp20/alpha crystallin family protein [Gammaproteobacteria bacterium]